MALMDAAWLPLPHSAASDRAALVALRAAVLGGVCRIGPKQSLDAPCLMRLIMDAVPHGPSRDRLVEAIAGRLPGAAMDRPQWRMMRYCRAEDASRKVVLSAIDAVLLESAGGIVDLPLSLWPRRVLHALR